jgi:hypothetical protein
MQKKKREMFRNISNKFAYTIIALCIVILLAIGVYAYGTNNPSVFGHSIGELAPPTSCAANQVLTWTGSAWSCTTPSSASSMGIDWIKTARGGGPDWIPTSGRWVYIDTGNTDLKHLRFDAYMDASGTGTSGTGVYQMNIYSGLDASPAGGTLIMRRNFETTSILATQFQISGDIFNTGDRYIKLLIQCTSGTCNTAYYGLQVTKFSS